VVGIKGITIGKHHTKMMMEETVGTDMTDGCMPSKEAAQVMSQGEGMWNSQPDTQPLKNSQDMEETGAAREEGVWGQLYPHCGTFPRIPLKLENYKMGRGKGSDYVVRESDMGSHKWLTAVSKTQCEIIRNREGVFLKDHSSNGTWVNGKKVGKGSMWPLEHNSDICFSSATKKVFVFMSMDAGLRETFDPQLTACYTVSKVLGRGATGEVRLGFRIPDLQRVAIKIINKKTTKIMKNTTYVNEVKILRSVQHPCVINLLDVIDVEDYLYIVLELAEGGELFDKIIEKTRMNESEAKVHFYQIASAIAYLHSRNICHRDLKPENVLLCSIDDSRPIIKITDMGLSKLVDLNTQLTTFCGTPQYIAPEIVVGAGIPEAKAYSVKVDCWSLGVILYILLSGTPPFSEERTCGLDLRRQILQADYVFYPQLFDSISAKAKDLISKLLVVNPEDRISADQILQHPWIQEDEAMVRKVHSLLKADVKPCKRSLEIDSQGGIHDVKRIRQELNEIETGVSIFKTPVNS